MRLGGDIEYNSKQVGGTPPLLTFLNFVLQNPETLELSTEIDRETFAKNKTLKKHEVGELWGWLENQGGVKSFIESIVKS